MSSISRCVLAAVFPCILLAGCKTEEVVGPETTDAEIRLANISGWYLRHVRQYGRTPRSDAEFFAYVRNIPGSERVIPVEQLDSYYISPRDKQHWVIRYSVPVEQAGESYAVPPGTVLMHESVGLAGKKLIVRGNGFTELVNDATLAELTR